MDLAYDPSQVERHRSAVFGVKTRLARNAALAPRLARLRHHGEVMGPTTEVVIEGHPRSANSFSVVAFEVAQGRHTEIAHHTHAAGHHVMAARTGVPAIALIREPADAVSEFLLLRPRLEPAQALYAWTSFYRTVEQYLDRVVLAPFGVVTRDFGTVIVELNARNGTAFVPFEHTDANVRRCFDAMDGYWRSRLGGGPELERVVGRPSAERERLLAQIRPLLERGRARDQLRRARDMYAALVGTEQAAA
jgi:hypothetical protein